MPERSRDWIRQAKRDFEMAKEAMRDGFYEWSCFAAQQVAEKAVKAVAWGHSVFELLATKISVPEDVLNCARYPNGFDSGYGGGCKKCDPLL